MYEHTYVYQLHDKDRDERKYYIRWVCGWG